MSSAKKVKKIKVTQVRGLAHKPEAQRRVVRALGLGRPGRSRIHDDTPAVRGMCDKVPHLVSVEEVK